VIQGQAQKQRFFNIFNSAIESKFLVISPLLSFFKIQVIEIFNRAQF
jgi:hypothetical protein